MPVGFGPRASWASSGSYFYWGFGDEYSISAFGSQGKLVRIIRRAWTPHTITASELKAWKEDFVGGAGLNGASLDAGGPGLRQLHLHNLENMMFASVVPAFNGMIADRLGNLWVLNSDSRQLLGDRLPAQSVTYSIMDVRGRWLCDTTVPSGVRVTDIGADYLAGVRTDSDGVEHAVLYRLSKP
jgi:hypothetical protein